MHVDDNKLLTWVARYHLLMMMYTNMKDKGFDREAERLLTITKEMRHEIADQVMAAVVESLLHSEDYRLLFQTEGDTLFKSLLSDMCRGAPLQ